MEPLLIGLWNCCRLDLGIVTDWITAISTIAMTIATVVLAIYAYLTVEEGKKNRRKDTIEKMLENVYSPLYEILRKAKFENHERGEARPLSGFEWAVYDNELQTMREIVEKFGHYFDDRAEFEKVSMLVQRPKRTRVGLNWFNGFSEVDMAEHFGYIKRRRDELTDELRELIKVS